MTGIAASFLLLDPEIKLVDAAINSFALLFINRLDEDFGKLEDVIYIATKSEEGLDHEEDDEEVATVALTCTRPLSLWRTRYSLTLTRHNTTPTHQRLPTVTLRSMDRGPTVG